nr:ATP-binding protein [Pyrinomonadaceae bacterium]
MRELYIDNYRGFSKQRVPIGDINFLVGENSSGKTSFLYLLSILGSYNLWYKRQFDSDLVEFNGFSEVVSLDSPDNSCFHIGVMEWSPSNLREQNDVFLMKFANESGRAILKKFCFLSHSHEFRVLFTKTNVKFFYSPVGEIYDDEGVRNLFEKWLDEPLANEKKYKPLRDPFPASPAFMKSLLPDYVQEERKLRQRYRTTEFPSFVSDLVWIAPIRTKPRRIYEGFREAFSPEGEHTPFRVKNLLSSKRQSQVFRDYIRWFGEESHLFDSVYTKDYGSRKSALFEFGVVLDGKELTINDVGYGVSQSLPIVIDLFTAPVNAWFAIQQPEVHLHPKAQAALGMLIFASMVEANKRFFIETHSDYLIDRFRMVMAQTDSETIQT